MPEELTLKFLGARYCLRSLVDLVEVETKAKAITVVNPEEMEVADITIEEVVILEEEEAIATEVIDQAVVLLEAMAQKLAVAMVEIATKMNENKPKVEEVIVVGVEVLAGIKKTIQDNSIILMMTIIKSQKTLLVNLNQLKKVLLRSHKVLPNLRLLLIIAMADMVENQGNSMTLVINQVL